MRRLVLITAALFLAVSSFAQVGIFGGLTTASASFEGLAAKSEKNFHLGAAYKLPLALGFVLQPSLSYSVKGTSLSKEEIKNIDLKMGYLEAALQAQWGVDLMLFRPYVLAEPFIGYAVNNKGQVDSESYTNKWDFVNRLEYGLGLGGGVELFSRLQLSCKYYWNFGQVSTGDKALSDAWSEVKAAISEKRSFNGLTVSLAFFF